MFAPKSEIYETLNSLGYYCLQGSQAVFSDGEVPAITFRIDNNSVDLTLDNQISNQNITATVDIWADDSPTTSRILGEVEAAMRSIGYRMSYSADVPNPPNTLCHTNCRFDGIK
jgi:hypothetical protein